MTCFILISQVCGLVIFLFYIFFLLEELECDLLAVYLCFSSVVVISASYWLNLSEIIELVFAVVGAIP